MVPDACPRVSDRTALFSTLYPLATQQAPAQDSSLFDTLGVNFSPYKEGGGGDGGHYASNFQERDVGIIPRLRYSCGIPPAIRTQVLHRDKKI